VAGSQSPRQQPAVNRQQTASQPASPLAAACPQQPARQPAPRNCELELSIHIHIFYCAEILKGFSIGKGLQYQVSQQQQLVAFPLQLRPSWDG
jgi:hypothetical protein